MDCPKELSARDRLGATWLNGLVRFVRSLRIIQGPGVKISRGPNGTTVSVDLPRIRSSAPSAALPTWRQGRFAIDAINLDPDPPSEDDPEGEDESELVLKNCFVRIGGKTYSMGTTLTGFKNAIVAIRIELNSSEPALEYQSYATVGDLNAAEADRAYYIIPLFQFDADGGVVLDWRLGPDASMGEF